MDGPSCLTGLCCIRYSGGMKEEKVSLNNLPDAEDICAMIRSSGRWWERLFFPKEVARQAGNKIRVEVVEALSVDARRAHHIVRDMYDSAMMSYQTEETRKARLLSILRSVKRRVSEHLNNPDADDRAFISNLEVDLTANGFSK